MTREPKKKKGSNPTPGPFPKKVKDPTSFDAEYFVWRVNRGYIDYAHPEFGWDKVPIRYFLQTIVQSLQSYEGLRWQDLKQRRHCHPWGVDDIPKDCRDRLEEREIDIVELYQISLGSLPRIIGYRLGSVFSYVV